MNKYIKTDLEQATSYMRIAILNALHDIDSGEEIEIDLGPNISWNLFNDCLNEEGWKEGDFDTNGWEIDFWMNWTSPSGKYCLIQGSLWCGQNYKIRVEDEK